MIKTILIILFAPSLTLASSSYGNGGVQQALTSAFGGNAGAGAKTSSCLLCHSTSSGGPGNVNTGFGADFQTAADRLGLGSGNGLSAIGANSLETIFADASFGAVDSDDDTESNRDEFLADTDPADNISDSSGGSGGGSSGGCGTIGAPPSSGPGSFLLLLALPLVALLLPKFRLR